MNAKTCKIFRMVACKATVGMPDRAYTVGVKGKTISIPQTVGPPLVFTNPDQVVLVDECTRAAYRQLKKQLRRTK